ncbi:MAG: NAD-dependent epimerase/dehydratase family protein, partial [Solirubrobacterales bacterium]
MNHLITGGAGFIGSHLADALCAQGDRVTILDDLSTGSRENVAHLLDAGSAELVEASVLDETVVDELMSSADTCFHLASAVGVELVIDRPLDSMLSNMRGFRTVAASAAESGTKLVYTSTSEVYGRANGRALTEGADRVYGAPTRSRWGYATTKV